MTSLDPLHESLRLERLDAQRVRPLRTRILRPGFGGDKLCEFAEDDAPDTAHFGLVDEDEKIAAVATFLRRDFPKMPGRPALQLRGMCVDGALQNRGLGARLLDGAAGRLALLFPDARILWCNARLSAETFYKKQGFERIGEAFEVDPIGPHVLMRRAIGPALADDSTAG